MIMETIFDHNVTDEELNGILGLVMSKDEYLKSLDMGNNKLLSSIYALYRLYLWRDDNKKADEYYNKAYDIDKEYAIDMAYYDIID